MSVCLGGDVGIAFLGTNRERAKFREKRLIAWMFRRFSASARFRLNPSASAAFRSGSLLVLASVGDMFVCLDNDVGGAFSETKQGTGQIPGKIGIFYD